MINLKNAIVLAFIMSVMACSTTQEVVKDRITVQEGFSFTSEQPTPFNPNYTQAVVKILRGNSVIGSGAFISNEGLFMSTYEPVLSHVAQSNDQIEILDGFSATTSDDEISLPGISILILLEEIDVTLKYTSRIPEQATNAEINQIKRQVTEELISEARSESPNTFVQITEVYSGNQLILSKYQLLNDIRLVWSESLNLSEEELADSELLFEAVSNSTALFRAYSNLEDQQNGYDPANVPFNPTSHFKITENPVSNMYTYALGFPGNTFRNSSARALTFYRDVINPAILNSYQPFKEIQDSISSVNTQYLYASLYSRFNTTSQINRYNSIQDALFNEPIIDDKIRNQNEYESWLDADSTIGVNYRQVFNFIDQAYDIAVQNGASFYNITYSNQLNQIDDLVSQAKAFIEQSLTLESDQEIEAIKASTLQNMDRIRSSMDVPTELNYVSYTLATLKSLPESQQLPSLDGVFSDASQLSVRQQALKFLERQRTSSFLFDPEKTSEAFENNTFYSDSLFSVIDELLFINDMNRNNHSIFISYLRPAEQVLNSAYLSFLGSGRFLPDANGTLRYNKGFIELGHKPEEKFFQSHNDFSANAKGSAIISQDGFLLGIVSNSSEYIAGNYGFSKENAITHAFSVSHILKNWKSDFTNAAWLAEIEN